MPLNLPDPNLPDLNLPDPNLPKSNFSRRRLLQSGLSGLGLILTGCELAPLTDRIGQASEPLNQRVQELLLKPQTPVPEFPVSAIQPEALLINTYDTTPQIDPAQFRLIVDGEVAMPLQFSLSDLQAMPLTEMVIRHVCVEGWAAIVQWGGVRLRDLVQLAQPKPTARYAYFESADRYYESWDLASAFHPQTLLAYQKNGAPLSVDNGAPLRLAAPVKLGYKQSKWVTRVTLTSQLSSRKGYWVDQGYEWFAGI
jgi:DMSO/TMAO reductase YedYZ molybdopterin-dependent catalytic subunit